MAISGWRIQHRDLVEGRRKSRGALFREEEDIVLMPIGIANECAERIEPPKPSRIFIGQTASLF